MGNIPNRMVDPICFYVNVCGNVEVAYSRENLDSQLKSELMTALQPAFARISDMGIRYSASGTYGRNRIRFEYGAYGKWVKLPGNRP